MVATSIEDKIAALVAVSQQWHRNVFVATYTSEILAHRRDWSPLSYPWILALSSSNQIPECIRDCNKTDATTIFDTMIAKLGKPAGLDTECSEQGVIWIGQCHTALRLLSVLRAPILTCRHALMTRATYYSVNKKVWQVVVPTCS